MESGRDVMTMFDITNIPKTKENIEKRLSLIKDSFLTFDSRGNGNDEYFNLKTHFDWYPFCQFLIKISMSFFELIVKKKSATTDLYKTPMNKKILDDIVYIYHFTLNNIDPENMNIDINGLLNNALNLTHQMVSTNLDMVQRFVNLIFTETIFDDKFAIVGEINIQFWEKAERFLCTLILNMRESDSQKSTLFLKSVFLIYKAMTPFKYPDLVLIIRTINHITSWNFCQNDKLALDIHGYISAIINQLILTVGTDAIKCLVNICVTISNKYSLKIWMDNGKSHSLIQDPNVNTGINSRLEIVKMWNNIYGLIGEIDDGFNEPSILLWLKEVTSCIKREIEYTESRSKFIRYEHCVPDYIFYDLAIKLISRSENENDNDEVGRQAPKHVKSITLIDKIVDNLNSDLSCRQIFWMRMLEVGLNNSNFVVRCQSQIAQIVSAINVCLNITNLSASVYSHLLKIVPKLMDKNLSSDNFCCLFESVFRCLLSESQALESLVTDTVSVLISIVKTGLLTTLPEGFWSKLMSLLPNESLFSFISHVILHFNTNQPYRVLISVEISVQLLNWLLSFVCLPTTSFSDLSLLITVLVNRKSQKADCYTKQQCFPNQHRFPSVSYENAIKSCLLKQCPDFYPRTPITEVLQLSINSLDQSGMNILLKTFEIVSLTDSTDWLIVIFRFFRCLDQIDNPTKFRENIPVLRKAILHLKSIATLNQDLSPFLVEGLHSIDWKHLSALGTKIPELSQHISIMTAAVKACLVTSVFSHFNLTNLQQFRNQSHCYLSIFPDNLNGFIERFFTSFKLYNTNHVDLLRVFIESIASFKIRIKPEIISNLLMIIKESFKMFKRNYRVYGNLIEICLNIISILSDSFEMDNQKDFINCFHDLSGTINKIYMSYFPECHSIGRLLAKLLALLFGYYWNNNSRIDPAGLLQARLSGICEAVFSNFSNGKSFSARLSASVFMEEVFRIAHPVVDLLGFFIKNFPENPLLITELWNSAGTDDELLYSDQNRARISSFLLMWTYSLSSEYSRRDISKFGSSVLPFITGRIPDISCQKPKSLSDFLSILYSKRFTSTMDITDFITAIMFPFIDNWIDLLADSQQPIELPGKVTISQIVQNNLKEFLWIISSCSDNDNRRSMISSYFPSVFDESQTVIDNLPNLVARIVISLDNSSSRCAAAALDYLLSILSIYEIRKFLNENILETIWEILSHLWEISRSFERFDRISIVLFSEYLNLPMSLSEWLLSKSGRFIDLVMFIVGKYSTESIQDSYPSIWCLIIDIILSSCDNWHRNTNINPINDQFICFLIIRHIRLLEISSKNHDNNDLQLLTLLIRLISFSHRNIEAPNLDVNIFWYQKAFYFIAECSEKYINHKSIINDIISELLSSPVTKYGGNLDGFIYRISGFNSFPSIILLRPEIDGISSIRNILISFDKFGLIILEKKPKSFVLLSEFLYGLLQTERIDPSIGDLLQKLQDILHLFLVSKMEILPSLKSPETSDAIISCLMYLKLLLPQYHISPNQQLAIVGKFDQDPVISDQIDLLYHLSIICLQDFGNRSWCSYLSLCSLYQSINTSKNRFLTDILSLFHPEKNNKKINIIYEKNPDFPAILKFLENSIPFCPHTQWRCELTKMLAVRSSKPVYNRFHPELVSSVASISFYCLPRIFATVEFSTEETRILSQVINRILHEQHYCESRKIVLVNCVVKKLEYIIIEEGNCRNNWEDIDFFKAAEVAYCGKMYTATLLLLDKLWLKESNTEMNAGIVNLYYKTFKSLASQEDLTADRFLIGSSSQYNDYGDGDGDSNDLLWLIKNGKFKVLHRLLKAEKNSDIFSFKPEAKIDILWKLSRWGDEEKLEINNLSQENVCSLAMYDFLYSRSEHVSEFYRNHVVDSCKISWDQEACFRPLIERATLFGNETSLPTILESLIRIANKSNIDQLDSSIVWALIRSNRFARNLEIVNQQLLGISDLAKRCKRHEYIDFIRDMLNLHEVDNSILKCSGESSLFRTIDIFSQKTETEETKKSFLQLEQFIYDSQKHILTCQQIKRNHDLFFKLYFKAVSKICAWNQEYPVHSVSHIRTKILEPAMGVFGKSLKQESDMLSTMSTFSYQQYTHINQYMRSSEYENRVKILTESKRDVSYLVDLRGKCPLRKILEKQSEVDWDELNNLSQDRERFLLSAAISCSECLQNEDGNDFKIFHLMSMWLSNESNEKLNNIISDVIGKIETHKFLVLMPQLCARLNSENNKSFEINLEKLIKRIILDHPFHSIYNLLAIRNANRDSELEKSKSLKSIKEANDKMNSRISVAYTMVEQLVKESQSDIIRDADILTTAYIHWANVDMSAFKQDIHKKLKFPLNCSLLRIAKQVKLPVPTLSIPIDRSLKYSLDRLPLIVGFDDVYSLQGGINLPKIVWCQSSDGLKRRQLVKSNDDLRQDSVMQQVFSVVNSLLGNKGSITYKANSIKSSDWSAFIYNRMISIRTYKVIPMTQTSGIIEWCEDTVPLGDWLANDKTGAHQRYRPQDSTPLQCRKRLQISAEENIKKRIETFKDILTKIQPVLGYFHFEKFPESQRWFKARKSYANSLAINSIVGFILGLGDRHVQNILLDVNTAELIHIDFGIAFDLGKLMPTQERVPFRLTRDLVHGLGPFGVEGRFKTTCCDVLNLLRSQKDIILTLIEVLLHDPLHSWKLNPQHARVLHTKREADNDCNNTSNTSSKTIEGFDNKSRPGSSQNQMAERVILEMSRKFAGAVDSSYLNCEGHVNYLIQTASNVESLARMFHGWQAYL